MGDRLVGLMFAVLVVVAAVLGAAPAVGEEAANVKPTVAVQHVSLAQPVLRDEAAMVLVGTALIALAAAVRRAA